MSATSARAARRERQTAAALGTERVKRKRGERAPDVKPIRVQTGHILQAECKSRVKLPRIAKLALEQARGYLQSAIPLSVVFEKGAEGRDGIVSLRLGDFAALVGLDVNALPEPQPVRRKRSPRDVPGQILLFGVTS